MSMTIIVLAMHGSPPLDFPRAELVELVGLHMHTAYDPSDQDPQGPLEGRHAELEEKIRDWPRTVENDPFHAASLELAECLADAAQMDVLLGFNEFCRPTLDEVLDQAVASGATEVVVVTPMTTRGGEHSERDIPASVACAEAKHPHVNFIYAWPFDPADVAAFLAAQTRSFASE